MNPRKRSALEAHARGSGPEADIARRKLGLNVGTPMGGGPGTAVTRRMPGAGGPRAIGPGGNRLPVLAPRALPGGGGGGGGTTTPVSIRPNPRGGGPNPRGGGITTPVTLGPTRKRPPGAAVTEAAGNARKLPKRGRGLMIGAGAAVIAGLAYSGRRGEGSSGGRTSPYRY